MTADVRRAEHVLVVVPVHNEQELLAGCLEALLASRAQALAEFPSVAVSIIVVLDSCTDGSASIAASLPVTTATTTARCVGVARRLGVEVGRLMTSSHSANVWTMHTDGDTLVSRTWIVDHLRLAQSTELVVGRVVPDPTGLKDELRDVWHERHPLGAFSVHGANLGLWLDVYDAAGGFRAIPVHEDRILVNRAIEQGSSFTIGTTVVTSARTTGRAPQGFASYLAALG